LSGANTARSEEENVVRPASSGVLQGVILVAVRGRLGEHPNATPWIVQEALGAAARVLVNGPHKSATVAKNERQSQAPRRGAAALVLAMDSSKSGTVAKDERQPVASKEISF
jgi:hypothetical protein